LVFTTLSKGVSVLVPKKSFCVLLLVGLAGFCTPTKPVTIVYRCLQNDLLCKLRALRVGELNTQFLDQTVPKLPSSFISYTLAEKMVSDWQPKFAPYLEVVMRKLDQDDFALFELLCERSGNQDVLAHAKAHSLKSLFARMYG